MAAQAIEMIAETVYPSVEELKDLVFNDYNAGTLGFDSLPMMEILFCLGEMGISPPQKHSGKTVLIYELLLEMSKLSKIQIIKGSC